MVKLIQGGVKSRTLPGTTRAIPPPPPTPGGGEDPTVASSGHIISCCRAVRCLLDQEASGVPAGGGDQPEQRSGDELIQESEGAQSSQVCSAHSVLLPALGALNARVRATKLWPEVLQGLSDFGNVHREGRHLGLSDRGLACSLVSQALGGIGVGMSPLECLGCSRGSL